MKKKYIVKESKEFEKIIKKGICKKNRSFIIYNLKNNLKYNRYGISVGKKIGNAVIRNKYKRKIRHIIDNCKKNYVNNSDYIIILRKGALEKNFQELIKDYLNIVQKGKKYENKSKKKFKKNNY